MAGAGEAPLRNVAVHHATADDDIGPRHEEAKQGETRPKQDDAGRQVGRKAERPCILAKTKAPACGDVRPALGAFAVDRRVSPRCSGKRQCLGRREHG
jgi:hypothetical protein